ncbi:hypothetical protein ACHAWO_002306 [Cyclotella atomus]|uniref:Uncharacterized protein n=1 Tax=Cyclotella atomus TaxID=382360 RepID=A0ABD3Q2Z6_9STRA
MTLQAVGEGGSGKTQVCLSAMLDCVMRHINGESNDKSPNNNATGINSSNNTTQSTQRAIHLTKLGAAPTIAKRLSMRLFRLDNVWDVQQEYLQSHSTFPNLNRKCNLYYHANLSNFRQERR